MNGQKKDYGRPGGQNPRSPIIPDTPPPLIGRCDCGRPGVVGIVTGRSFCWGHLDEAIALLGYFRDATPAELEHEDDRPGAL